MILPNKVATIYINLKENIKFLYDPVRIFLLNYCLYISKIFNPDITETHNTAMPQKTNMALFIFQSRV